jgi:hypothetical protein
MNTGASFEYKINNDVKRSRLSVSLYIVIQRNGFIEEDLIATSKPTKYTKYKKGETDADSLGYVAANLRKGGLKDLIAESRDLILYRYSEVIDPDPDKLTERTTNNSPSGVTRAAAAYIPQTESESKKRKPNNLVELLSGRDNQNQSFLSKSGMIELVKSESNLLTDADALRKIKNESDGYGSAPVFNQSAQPATPTDNKSNVSTDFSVANLDKNNELMKFSNSKGDVNNNTTITNNNQSNAITSSSTNTFSDVSDNSRTITDLYKSKSNYEYILDKKNRDQYTAETLKIAKTELAKVDADIKKEITKYNKAHPGDNKYKTEAEVKKEQLKTEAQTKKTDSEKAEKPAGVEKALAKVAEANKLAESPKIENKSSDIKIEPTSKDSKLPKDNTPAAITKESAKSSDDDSAAKKIISDITKPLEFKQKEFDELTRALVKGDSNINTESEKKETDKFVKPGEIKKQKTDVKKLNQTPPTPLQMEQKKLLQTLVNSAKTTATNTSINNTNTSNNKTNNKAAAANQIKLDNTQPLKPEDPTKPNEPKEDSESVDNSQSELNSQLLNAIYDLLSTGIKVKY